MASTYFIRPGPVPSDCLRKLAQGAEIAFGDRAETFQREQASERGRRDNGLINIAAARVAELAIPPTIMSRAVLTSAHTIPYAPRNQADLDRWAPKQIALLFVRVWFEHFGNPVERRSERQPQRRLVTGHGGSARTFPQSNFPLARWAARPPGTWLDTASAEP